MLSCLSIENREGSIKDYVICERRDPLSDLLADSSMLDCLGQVQVSADLWEGGSTIPLDGMHISKQSCIRPHG